MLTVSAMQLYTFLDFRDHVRKCSGPDKPDKSWAAYQAYCDRLDMTPCPQATYEGLHSYDATGMLKPIRVCIGIGEGDSDMCYDNDDMFNTVKRTVTTLKQGYEIFNWHKDNYLLVCGYIPTKLAIEG